METDKNILFASSSDLHEKVVSGNSNSDASNMSQNNKTACPSCKRMFCKTNGIVLKVCQHFVCKECIIDYYFKNQKMTCQFQPADGVDSCGRNFSKNEVQSVLKEIGINQLDETIFPDPNVTDFCCGICCLDYPYDQAFKLTQCSHHVCKLCLRAAIKVNTDPEIRCPYANTYVSCASYLTHSEIRKLTTADEYKWFEQIGIKNATEPSELLFLLTMCDELNYIQNAAAFDCPICFVPCDALQGIRLRDCFHEFCLECFTSTVSHSEDDSVKCPFTDDNLRHCESFVQEREIRAVVPPDIYNKFLERKLKLAEHSIANTFHCKTVDCPAFFIMEEGDDVMYCGICKETNCLKCKAIHKNQTCEKYQDSLNSKITEECIDNLKNTGEVMNCPKCQALINKIAGCSWLQCIFCKIEICWATKGPRWGPNGKGDTSGGCKCGINGKSCHPQCGNCH